MIASAFDFFKLPLCNFLPDIKQMLILAVSYRYQASFRQKLAIHVVYIETNSFFPEVYMFVL